MNDTWICHICGKRRPDRYISVRVSDISEEHGLPIGTMKQNVRYCNDKVSCIQGSLTKKFFKKLNSK